MLRKAVLLAAFAAVVLPPAAAADRMSVELMPRITHIKDVRTVGGARVVFHVVLGPQPGGLYDLQPVLSNNEISDLETLRGMQRRLLPRANVVGVNGDLFRPASGSPSGILVRRRVLMSTPTSHRSSLGIGVDGLLRIARIRFKGLFQIGPAPAHRLKEFNRAFEAPSGFALYSRAWGAHTPMHRRTHELILEDVARTFPNRDRAGRIVRVVQGSGHAIPAGGAILQARGIARALLNAEAAPGMALTFRLGLVNWWENVNDAIGGGPLLVSGGVPVYRPDEWFTSYQLALRHPRTAVGQTADGRIILLVADGRSDVSHGLTMNQLANAMAHYGAQRAMAFDGGGSSEMAFNGSILNRPSDGGERPLSNSLQLVYIGAYARKPRRPVFSPNGDGYADGQRLYAKFVRASNVHLQLFRPDGRVKWEYRAAREPGIITKSLGSERLMQGTWRWVVSGTDAQGRASRMARRFRVNNTLGFLQLSTRTMRVRARRGGHLRIGFKVTRTADVRVAIERAGSAIRHLVFRNGLSPGAYAVIWNGRNDGGRVVGSGKYAVVVRAKNGLGSVMLPKGLTVTRVT